MVDDWPGRAADPFADRINEIRKYVVSRTLAKGYLDWSNLTLLSAAKAIGAVRELRAREGVGVQVMGSPSLAKQLVANDLVDEYCLMIEPIVLGLGKRLFPEHDRTRPLELVSTSASKTGVLICNFRPIPR